MEDTLHPPGVLPALTEGIVPISVRVSGEVRRVWRTWPARTMDLSNSDSSMLGRRHERKPPTPPINVVIARRIDIMFRL